MQFDVWLGQLDDLTTFDMTTGKSLDCLEIRPAGENLCYFYDTVDHRLIKSFLLEDRERVALFCGIRLIAHDGKYSPRLRLWKRDKSKRAVKEWEAGSIRGAHIIKALVDTEGGHKNFIRLMAYLLSFDQVEAEGKNLRVIEGADDRVIEILRDRKRDEIIPILEAALDGPLTGAEIATLTGRKEHLNTFDRLLNEPGYIESLAVDKSGTEAVWQDFFEKAPWIFGYGLDLVAHSALDAGKLERITVGNSLWAGGGKRSDAVMRTRARISTLLFCEIKKHDTDLLKRTLYRRPDTYAASDELVGGTAQLQKTVRKVFRYLLDQIQSHTDPDGTPTGLDFSTSKPKQVLLAGNLNEFRGDAGINGEKMESFELYRKSHSEVEIITFDELYERAKFIING